MTRALWIAALPLLLAGCGGDASEDEGALRDAAQEQADRFASGDYEGAWDMWTNAAKAEVSGDLYAAYVESCVVGSAPLEVSNVRIDEPGEGTVRIALAGLQQSYSMLFEDGEWRWVPSDSTLDALGDASVDNLPAC